MAYGETYEQFVEKFTPKRTTDDCYTPEMVYQAIKDWAVKEYHLEGRPIVRPFYPGGDYAHFDYPEKCVVLDNPPFSLLSKIKGFYLERGMDFFLFCPQLTMLASLHKHRLSFVCGTSVTYENGAVVPTAFCTNMGGPLIRGSSELCDAVNKANHGKINKKKVTKRKNPLHLTSGAILRKLNGMDFTIEREDCQWVTRAGGIQIYGRGLLLNTRKAEEKRRLAEGEEEIVLTEEELAIIRRLDAEDAARQKAMEAGDEAP